MFEPPHVGCYVGGIVHGKQQPGLAFAVAVVRIVMARRGGEEPAFADGKILVVEGQGEVAAYASGGAMARNVLVFANLCVAGGLLPGV